MSETTDPSTALIVAVNAHLGDRHFRDSVRGMHRQSYPLVKMIEALGLEDDMSPAVREILENLSPNVVDGIRLATLEMLDRADCRLLLSCGVTDAGLDHGVAADLEIVETASACTIEVRRSRPTKSR